MKKVVAERSKLASISPEAIQTILTAVEKRSEDSLRLESQLEVFFKQVSTSLIEIYSLCGNSEFSNHPTWLSNNMQLFRDFITSLIEFSLFGISFGEINPTCAAIQCTKRYMKRIQQSCLTIIDKTCTKKSSEALLEIIYDLLKKEIGFNIQEEKIFFRILHTINDPGRSKRICFLLDQAKVILMTLDRHYPAVVSRVNKLLYEILYICTAPSVIKSCSALQQVIRSQKLPVKISAHSYLNTFQVVNSQKVILQDIGQPKSQVNLSTKEGVDVLSLKKIDSFLDGTVDANLMAMIVARMGQLINPSSDVREGNLSSANIAKLIDMPIISRVSPTSMSNVNTYRCVIHQASEVNFIHLVKVVYHLDQIYELVPIPAIDDWKKFKDVSKLRMSRIKKVPMPDLEPPVENTANDSGYYKLFETTIEGIPHQSFAKPADNSELPIGWYLNSNRNFIDLGGARREKKLTDKRKPTKQWNLSDVTKIMDRVKIAQEKIIEPKEEDSDDVKQNFVKEMNSLIRLNEVCAFVIGIAQSLNKFGFAKLIYKGTVDKATEFAINLEAAIQGKVKPITYDHFSAEVKNVLAAKDAKETQEDSKIEYMPITVCNLALYYQLKDTFDKIFPLNHGNNKITEGLNNNSIISTSLLSGAARGDYLSRVSDILRRVYLDKHHPEQPALEAIIKSSLETLKTKDINTLEETDRNIMMGAVALIGGWDGSLTAGCEVKIKDSGSSKESAVIKVPQNSGKLASTIISNSDENISTQYVNYKDIQKKIDLKNNILPYIELNSILDAFVRIETLISKIAKDEEESINEKGVEVEKWTSLIAVQMISSALVQCIHKHPSIHDITKHEAYILLISKSYESIGTPSLRLILRKFIAWEGIVDKMSKLSHLIFHPKAMTGAVLPLFEKFMITETKTAKELKSQRSTASKQTSSYRLPASSYTDCLPRSNPKATNYKMVKYWDKNIIPKIENFVRSTFSEFQMKDYFEQLRIALRVLDHIKACGIAFKLCDGGLPNGCVVPEADYDWDTIDIEDIQVGSLVSVKLQNRGVVLSNKIEHLYNLGMEEIVGEVLIVEHQMRYALVLVRDHNLLQCLTLWVPQQCINPIEYPVNRLGHSYSYKQHYHDFNVAYSECQTFLAQNILMKTAALDKGIGTDIDSYKIMKWLIISEHNSNLVSGWLHNEQRFSLEAEKNTTLVSKVSKKEKTRLNMLEADLTKICKDEAYLDYLIKNIQDEATEIVNLLNENSYTTNLKDKLEVDVGQKKHISPLNIFEHMGAPKNSVCAIAVTFDKPAYMGLTSGVKFFSDKEGVHSVNHIFNNQQDVTLSNIPPILFHSNEIYYQSYHSVEGVPLWNRNLVHSDLPCIVHGIPYSWTPCCWMIDTLSSVLISYDDIKFVPKINLLLKTSLKLSQEIKGPSIIKQILYILSNRLVRKMKCLVRRHQSEFLKILEGAEGDSEKKDYIQTLFDVEPSYVDALLEELKRVLEIEKDNHLPEDMFPLYSAYTQDLIELLGAILSPMHICEKEFKDKREVPSKLEDLISFNELMEYFKDQETLSQKNLAKIKSGLSLNTQTKNFVLLTNLPRISKADFIKLITDTLKLRGGRLLSPYLDIYVTVDNDDLCSGMAVIFIEGWNIPETDDDVTMQEEKEDVVIEEAPPAPAEPAEARWICPACTLENDMASDRCDICESAKPANPQLAGDMDAEAEKEVAPPIAEDEMVSLRVKVWYSTLQLAVKKFIQEKNLEENKKFEAAKVAKEAVEKEKQAKALTKSKKSKATNDASSPDQPEAEQEKEVPLPEPMIIEIPKLDFKFGAEILQTNECIEALLNRIVLDEFQKPLDAVLEAEYKTNQNKCNTIFSVSDLDRFLSAVKDCEPQDFIENLAKLGIDFWLDKVIDEDRLNEPVSEVLIRELIKMIEKDICNESRFYSYFKSRDIRLITSNPIITHNKDSENINEEQSLNFIKIHGFEAKFQLLQKLSTLELRTVWEKIALYNNFFLQLLPLINMSTECHAKMGNDYLTIGGFVSHLRYQCLSYVKSSIKTEIMSKTSLRTEVTPAIKVARLTEDDESGKIDEPTDQKDSLQSLWKMKDKYTFLKAFEQLKEIPLTMLRPEKVKGSGSFVAFKVVLEGEHVQGLSGPYRQFFADISAELQPVGARNAGKKSLGMFIPTPNAEHKFGEDRHKFTMNPSANSSFYLQLYETLGVLMGCAMRTDSYFTLDLPSLIWKKIIGVEVTMADVELVDKHFVENLRHLEDCDQAKFEQMAIESFTTKLSDGSVFELIPNGLNTKVTYERKNEYMELCLKARLNESSKQVDALAKGLKLIVPEPYFNIITHTDIELEICGTNEIDFKLLKRNTIYSGGITESSDLIKNFWEVLNDMKDNDKLKLIKFCWGQERLPASDDEYKRTQTRFMIKPSMSTATDQDGLLPKADTCFFNLELPAYSTKEVIREKLTLVVNLDCDSMNAEIVINELHDHDREYDDYAE